jgi:hypothetical protein
MSVTIVTRWSTPDISAAMDILKRAKAIQLKHGAVSFHVNQIYTGEFTGQLIVAAEYADLAAWGRAQANMVADMQPLLAETAKLGGVLQQRVILMGLDV